MAAGLSQTERVALVGQPSAWARCCESLESRPSSSRVELLLAEPVELLCCFMGACATCCAGCGDGDL